MHRLFLALAFCLVGCEMKGDEGDNDDDWGEEGDGWDGSTEEPWDAGPAAEEPETEAEPTGECTEAPIIEHDEIRDAQPSSADVLIVAHVYVGAGCEDNPTVNLFFRPETVSEWDSIIMTRGQEEHRWRGIIGAHLLNSAKIYYYVRAVDEEGRETVLPEGADTAFLDAFSFGIST